MISSFLADPAFLEDIIRILFVFVLITAAFTLSTRNIASLLTVYAVQSLLLVLIAVALYLIEGNQTLLAIAALTLVTKVLLIPIFINLIGEKIKISRDLKFNYLEPTASLLVSMGLVLLAYVFLSGFFNESILGKLFSWGLL
jgi:hydrogenase-4 component E